MTRLLIAGLLSLALIIRELFNAPEGYEDEHGFHIIVALPTAKLI
jgi:hypothetical protein